MADLHRLKLKRGAIKGQLTRTKSYIDTLDLTEISELELIQVKARLDSVEPLLSQFEDIQADIESHMVLELTAKDADVDIDAIINDQSSERANFEKDYFAIIVAIRSILKTSDRQSNSKNKSSSSSSSSNCVNQKPSIKLPDIKLPVFDGSYEKWLEFRDAFQAIVHNNVHLSDVEKFFYLKSFLSGEPLYAIANLQVTNDNYSNAWTILTDRYENKRLIVYNYVKDLFDCPKLIKESYSELRKLYDLFNKNLRSLKCLGQEVEHWDTLIVFMLTNKFDLVTRREWESFPINGELPNLEDVNKFLKAKCELLEKLESSKRETKLSNKPEKVKCYVATTPQTKFSCYFCKKPHSIYKCFAFKNLNVQARVTAVGKLKLCVNCFSPEHTKNCPSLNSCRHCGEKHNSLLHINAFPVETNHNRSNSSTSQAADLEQSKQQSVALTATIPLVERRENNAALSLLATAKIQVLGAKGEVHVARALLDPGSQSNFISESLVDKLGLERHSVNFKIIGVGQTLSTTSSSKINVTIMSNIDNGFIETIPCLVISQITQSLPSVSFDVSQWKIPRNICLADAEFNVQDKVDILLGNDVFFRILLMKQIRNANMPILQNTRLGWIVGGSFIPSFVPKSENKVLACLSLEQEIDNNLTKFWALEEFDKNVEVMSKAEQYCEDHFVNSFSRDFDGRFVVSFPFKENINQLGLSKQMAYKRLLFLEKRLIKDEWLKREYVSFLNEYRDLGHMTKVTDFSMDSRDSNKYFYLPHHAVVKETSLTTKVRVVFDASAQSDTGVSLNDVQHVGPTIQNDLLSILLNFRIFPFVINADITKMYRQILIHPDERKYQRILWKNPDDPSAEIECFELNTVTYGCASSPFLAVRSLYQLGLEFKDKYPQASHTIMNCFYLDDLLAGEFSQSKLLQLQHEITLILDTAGFKLRKWLSNKPELMGQFSFDENQSSCVLPLGEGQQNKTLGIFWDAAQDSIHFSIKNVDTNSSVTKRLILSVTSQIFDPLGLLGPIVIVAKIILQSLWQEKLTWDEPVSQSIKERWLDFCKQLQILNQLNIPRHVLSDNWKISHIHAFADASEKAYGACVYMVGLTNSGECVSSHLMLSKSRVAPLKKITLPRLELCAAYVAAKLVNKVKQSIDIQIDKYFYWTDSSITLCWIQGCPSRWKTFVANRVTQIQNLSKPEDWYHVRTENNPADCISRGTSAAYLLESELWWKGPRSLISSPITNTQNMVHLSADIPEQRVLSHCAVIDKEVDFDFSRFSSLLKLQRTIATCFRAYNRLKTKTVYLDLIQPEEFNNALMCLVRMSQIQSFPKEHIALQRGKDLSNSSSILCLNPYLDEAGLIRVGGRLHRANLLEDQKHPLILHNKHHLTALILRHEHVRLLHCGAQQLLYSVRLRFWPISGRGISRQIVRNCVICFKAKPITQSYQMGNLPKSRIMAFQPVFTYTGIDYAGPVTIRDRKTRNPKFLKSYICIFVCMSTKCVHLEVVSDLTTPSFIAVLKRFIARRGKPLHIYSDNGSTFIGANSTLLEFLKSSSDEVGSTLSAEGISWHFNPPQAPNFGGLWEAGVKSFKFHLKRIIGDAKLTYEDLCTVLIQIEGVLNSRPLSPLSTDPQDPTPLTPAHFLMGKPLTTLPEPDHTLVMENRLSKYQHLQSMVQHFWKRWNVEYISELQSRLKWKKSYPGLLSVGSLVIIKEDNVPVCRWKTGRVLELYPGLDGVTRVVSVLCANGVVYKRAVTKLCVLPL